MTPPQRQHVALRDILDAYLEFRRHEGNPDFADSYERRYKAFSSILGIDLSRPPTEGADARAKTIIHHVFEDVTRFYFGITTPFAGYLEAPRQVFLLAAPYEERFQSLAAEQKKMCLDLLDELAEAIYGQCERQVDPGDLERLGAADLEPPDSDDYL